MATIRGVAELLAVAQRRQRKPHANATPPVPAAPPTLPEDVQRSFEQRPSSPSRVRFAWHRRQLS
jgi:hypothetical protein